MTYIPTIGLEVHVQLKTRSKMFCGCPVEYGAPPNSHTCPVCLGYPGALPVMNEEALKMSALTGLMLGCAVPDICKFDRKNYFYPDMPKNYQITQFDQPICQGGAVPLHDFAYPKDTQKNIAHPGKSVRLTRIHLEEDVAKSQHFESSTGIDFNRAGTPLMEIVSEPEIETPEEAFAYLTALQQILIYGGVSDADMEKGQLRCDCNVSVRPEGTSELGVKIEIKNMNSISGVRRALAYEIERQMDAARRGEKLIQSTRRWDDDAGQTFQMRVKESSHDYRYFPDPDLLPVDTRDFMAEVRAKRPELPGEKRERLVTDYGLSAYVASVIADEREFAAIYESLCVALEHHYNHAFEAAQQTRTNWSSTEERAAISATMRKLRIDVANFLTNDLKAAYAETEKTMSDHPISTEEVTKLVRFIYVDRTINLSQGKIVLKSLIESGGTTDEIIQKEGLNQVSDTGALEALCDQAIANSAKAVAEYKAGKAQAINSIKGQVMKLSQGKANPQIVGEILVRKLAQ